MADDDDDEIDESELFCIKSMKGQSWPSKDKRVHTIRMSDTKPINDMKIYLFLCEQLHEMEKKLGISGDPPLVQ